ncbi:MAG: hypothetical protein GX444_14390 [Myxococcales bacterium]|nr:hypothetical protein [Myxococcales bacterium]
MKILINGQEFIPTHPIQSWEELIEQVGCQSEIVAGMISSISIDGIPVNFSETDPVLTPIEMKGDLIEIKVENPAEILQRSLMDGAELLSLLREESFGAAESFRKGREGNGQEQLGLVLEKVGLFMEYISEIFRFIEVSFDGFTGGLIVQELIGGLRDTMKNIIACQENRDLVMLADSLEFELVPVLARWREFLTSEHFSLDSE